MDEEERAPRTRERATRAARARARAASRRQPPRAAGSRTRTVTITPGPPDTAEGAPPPATDHTQPPTLRLRLVRRRGVSWTADTHDNEHDNKRSSKSCCIFHKKRAFDESSTESDEDASDRESDADKSDASSSSGGQPRTDTSHHVREKLRELENLRAQTATPDPR